MKRHPLRVASLLAIAAHAAMLVLAPRARVREGESARRPLDEAPLVAEIEVESSTLSPAPVDRSPTTTIPEVERSDARRDVAAPRSFEARRAAAPPSTPAEPTASADDGAWTFSPAAGPASSSSLSGVALGSAVSAGVRATVAETRDRRDPLRPRLPVYTEREMELGLVPGGNLVALTRDRVRVSLTPTVGHAVLEFHMDGRGIVASVRVVDASSDRAAWDDVAARIARDAQEAPPARIPAGARGVTLTLAVDSSERSASGQAPTDKPVAKVLRAINDPLDALVDGTSSARRVVAARVVGVEAF